MPEKPPPDFEQTRPPPLTSREFPDGAFDAPVVERVMELLATVWDPGARVVAATSRSGATAADAYREHAMAICGILAAGGNLAQIAGYLRQEEEKLLGGKVTSGRQRWSVGYGAACAMGKIFRKRAAEAEPDQAL